MNSVHFQGKPFNSTVIQVYSPTTIAEEAEVERFYEDLEGLLGEGNGNPLQYSCLENPMDAGAWYGVVRGVAKSWTLLK